ncbi:MAG TPA: FG-GAP-like repeat-containing protein [Thermoanaerobaculia bacterium]|nr:FG-GAP-like repeat-containing protein [Thermoanaerobaculia bacterium]
MRRRTHLSLRPALILLGLLAGLDVARAEPRPGVIWSLHRRELGFSDWRSRLALGLRGEVWIGGGSPAGTPGGLLYHWHQGEWSPSPVQAARTFVLAVDPAGTLWLCPYSPADESTYAGLHVRRYDGRDWQEEVVTPGIWPQAMAMVSPDEGWIGGNNGNLLHRTGGQWRQTALPLGEEERRGMNILALRMSSREEGWLVGAQGLVAHYFAGQSAGQSAGAWRLVPVPAAMRSENLYALDVTTDGSLWVAGSRGLLARLDAHGWHSFAAPHPFNLLGLDMVSPGDGWAVGEYGTILRWDGRAWRPQVSPTLASLYDVAMASAGEGWIVGDGVLLRSSPRDTPLLRDASLRDRYRMSRQPAQQIAAVDADGDGDLELFSLQPTSIHLYENRGEEGFYEIPGLPAPPLSILKSAAWGDVDGDGDLDLLVLSGSPAAAWLYRNLGGLRFAPPERLAVGPLGDADSAAFIDLDGDGDLDLYITSVGPVRQTNQVYLNDGSGRFPLGTVSNGSKGLEMFTLWGDLDGDMDLDAVLGNGGQELSLLINEGGRLRDATAGSGLDVPLVGEGRIFQGALLDLDRDGDLDLLLLGEGLYVFLNDGKAHFRRDDSLFDPVVNNPVVPSTLSSTGDLDHDGFPEVLLQTVSGGRRTVRLFSRGPDGHYHDIAPQLGLADRTGNAALFADLDGDGDLDLYIASSEESYLLENLADDSGYLTVRLHGDRSNRSAVGARVRIYGAGHLGEPAFLRGHQQLGVGFNPSGVQNLSALHFGLDARRRYDVEVTFPSGRRVVERSVATGRTLDVDESPPGLRQLVLGWRWSRRAWRAADPRREGVKLGLAALMLLGWRRYEGRRPGAKLLARRWGLAAGLFGGYLLTAACLAADARPTAQGLQLPGFAGALGLLSFADRRLGAWRSSHHLGSYRLQELLGEGGMGAVYRARNVVTGKTVALKVLHPWMMETEEHRVRFLREGRILARLEHPNVVKVFETGEVDGRGYISMELLAGVPLRWLVRQRGPLPPAAVRALLAACCDALGYVHRRGVVHRDVKSDNLFLLEPEAALPVDEAGWQRRLRLMDFGLAHASDMNTLTGRPALLGTLAYMPPEQLLGQALDARSDLYSLGVVAYEALTGRLPFEAGDEGSLLACIQTAEPVPLGQWRPDLPVPLTRLIEGMLSRSPRGRPASAEALSAALAALGRSEGGEPDVRGALGETGASVGATAADEPAVGSETWQELYREALCRLEEGRTTEAHVLTVECLAELRKALLPLENEQRESYCRQHGVAAALELMGRLSD